MKIFISWSGAVAKDVASLISHYLALIVPGTSYFVSADELDKGSRWSSGIAKELEDSNFGILILNRQNLGAPWLFFEAGALSKSLERGRVTPLLFGLDIPAISGTPLGQFQCAFFEKADFKKLCLEVSKLVQGLEPDRMSFYFEKFWPDLEEAVENASKSLPVLDLKKDPTEQALRDVYRRLNTISSRLAEPNNILPIDHIAKAIAINNDKNGLVGPMVQHIEECERIISDIKDDTIFLDVDSMEEVRDFSEKVVSLVEDFKTLADKRKPVVAGGLLD